MRPTLTKGIKEGVGLYPVIYDDIRYDASQYMAWAFLKMFGICAPNPDILSHKNVLCINQGNGSMKMSGVL